MTDQNPRRALHAGSIADRITNLEPGDNVTFSAPHGSVGDSFDAWVTATKRRLTNTVNPKVNQVSQRHPDREFEIETGVMISSQNRAHVVLVVTRLADLG
jgi:hypothetical protein